MTRPYVSFKTTYKPFQVYVKNWKLFQMFVGSGGNLPHVARCLRLYADRSTKNVMSELCIFFCDN